MELNRNYRLSAIFTLVAIATVLIGSQIVSTAAISSSTTLNYNQFGGVESDCNYVVFPVGSNYVAKSCIDNSVLDEDADAEAVIETALNALTASRSSKETVVLKGDFTIDGSITIPSYAIIEIQGKLTRSGNGFHLLSAASVTDVEIRGGIIQSAAKAVEAYDTNEIDFTTVTNGIVTGVTILDAAEDAIKIKGASSNVKVVESTFIDPNRHAVDVSGSSHNIIIANNYVNGTLIYDALTVYVDTSGATGDTITIEGNVVENVDGTAPSSSAIHVEDPNPSSLNNFVISGNAIYNSQYGITSSEGRPIAIIGNVIRNTDQGIKLFNPTLSTITGNVIDNSENTGTSYGIHIDGFVNGVIANNVIRGPGSSGTGYGIYWTETGSFTDVIISGNYFTDTIDGIRYTGSRNIYDNNIIENSRQVAIRIQDGATTNMFSNNIFYNNGQAADDTYSDIHIEGTASGNTLRQFFKDNIFIADASNRPAYNINYQSGGNMNNIVVDGNRFGSARSGVFNGTDPVSSYIVRNNLGYTTENEGTGTITTTNANVTHGLAYTPSAAECTVTLTEDPTDAVGSVWISGITSTQFTVNVESDPGTSNLDFSWACRRI